MLQDSGLRASLKPGRPMTLVLGAGVSIARGLPLWSDLLREVWRRVFRKDFYAHDGELIRRAKESCRRAGLPVDFIERLDVSRHPFELQLAFEQIFDHLRWLLGDSAFRKRLGLPKRFDKLGASRASNEQQTADVFSHLLREALYRRRRRPTNLATNPDTLSLIARAVQRNAKLEDHNRVIDQVITFNVDDLLEREVNAGCRRTVPYAVPIARASAVRPLNSARAIPIYHLHGFVPMASSRYNHWMGEGWIENVKAASESLVFTDEQYWRTVGNPAGFASRIFANALSGRCVFIGLSMTDVNIIRWLAQDAIERSDDFRRLATGWDDPTEVESNIMQDLSRHYWITQRRPDQVPGQISFRLTDVLRNTLGRRGVTCIDIPSWHSKEFQDWWRACFLS